MKNFLFFILKQVFLKFAFDKAKKKAIIIYLKTLQAARKSLLFAFIIFSFFQLMIVGFVGSIATGVWLLPIDDQHFRLLILFSAFLLMFLVPISFLMFFFSEKNWYKVSGAEKYFSTEGK